MINTFVSFCLFFYKRLRGIAAVVLTIATIEYQLSSLLAYWSDDTACKG